PYGAPGPLRSFPTRRSSDLPRAVPLREGGGEGSGRRASLPFRRRPEAPTAADLGVVIETCQSGDARRTPEGAPALPTPNTGRKRSEEHTSELQSHLKLVCRL